MIIRFTVYGQPMPQGSKKSMPIFKDGEPLMKNGRTLTRVVNDNPKLGQWRQQVAEVARAAYDGEPIDGPVLLRMQFFRSRPKGHFGTGRNAAVLKDSAPWFPTTRPDTLKLARAVEDSLTGVIWNDDSQVVRHKLAKDWGKGFYVEVTIETLQGAGTPDGGHGGDETFESASGRRR